MPRDFILDDNGDLLIKDGHYVIGESTSQHKKCLMLAEKGEYRQFPFVGIGLGSFINDDLLEELASETQKQYELDGMKVSKIEVFEDGRINEKASY